VPVVNSLSGDADPFLSADERVLLFGSSRDGGGDLYYAVRDTPDLDFDPPAPLPGVNTAAEEGDPTMTDDGCELYFSSERAGGLGGRDVWRARFLVP
jgi:Tol biopolymer transport system component